MKTATSFNELYRQINLRKKAFFMAFFAAVLFAYTILFIIDFIPEPIKEVVVEEPVSKIKQEVQEEVQVQYVEAPNGINQLLWNEWQDYRKQIKKPLTDKGLSIQLKLLCDNMMDHEEIINNSIQNNWTGLFPLKKQKVTKSSNPTHDAIDRYFAQQNQGEIIDARID